MDSSYFLKQYCEIFEKEFGGDLGNIMEKVSENNIKLIPLVILDIDKMTGVFSNFDNLTKLCSYLKIKGFKVEEDTLTNRFGVYIVSWGGYDERI